MPRICDSTSEPIDFCADCFPKSEDAAHDEFGDVGDGPDGRGNCFEYDTEHPSYEFEDYRCHRCKCQLTEDDDCRDYT